MIGLPHELEPLTKIVGLIASLVAVSNTLAPKIIDRTSERQSAKLAESIDDLLAKLRASEVIVPKADLTVYKDYLNLSIQTCTDQFVAVERARVDRLTKRNSLPEGWRSWLLFYRPESAIGAFTHMLFYFSLAFGVVGAAIAFTSWLHRDFETALLELLIPAVFGWYSFWLRSMALRDKKLYCAIRLGILTNPNGDLSWIRRWSLAFHAGPFNPGRDVSLRFFYYVFLVAAARTLVKSDWRDWQDSIWTIFAGAFQFCLAFFLRADFLRIRALRLLPSTK